MDLFPSLSVRLAVYLCVCVFMRILLPFTLMFIPVYSLKTFFSAANLFDGDGFCGLKASLLSMLNFKVLQVLELCLLIIVQPIYSIQLYYLFRMA